MAAPVQTGLAYADLRHFPDDNLRRERDLYEHNGVPEYWYVDLEADRIEVYRLDERGLYQTPTLHERGTHVTSRLLPVFALAVNDALGEADPG